MSNILLGTSIFIILGIILLTQPWQLFERNGPSMVRMVMEKPSYRMYLKILGYIFIALGIVLWIYSIYPQKIHASLTGVKFKGENMQAVEPVNLEVDGELAKELFQSSSEFWGKIIIGEKSFQFTDYPLKLDKNGMGEMDYIDSGNMNTYGRIFINNRFKEITIWVYKKEKGGYSWSSSGGDLISAPCSSREEAVRISNDLIKKVNKDVTIH